MRSRTLVRIPHILRASLAVVCVQTYVVLAWVAVGPNPASVLQRRSHAFGSRCRTGSPISATPLSSSVNEKNDDEKLDLKLLLIDHYDSFTYNLADLLAQLCVEPPTVLAADCVDTWEEFLQRQLNDNAVAFDGVILSPGPGHPNDAICALSKDCIRQNSDLPVLGVCLGHQILGQVYGAIVDHAPEPVHGQVKGIRLLETSSDRDRLLWKGIAEEDGTDNLVQVTRYHSLQVSQLEGTKLRPIAVTEDKDAVLMAMQHEEHPHFGVQFHPESIGTNETGKQLLRNFAQVCWDHKQKSVSAAKPTTKAAATVAPQTAASSVGDKLVHSSATVTTTTDRDSFTSSAADAPYSIYIHKVANLPPNGANMQPKNVMDELLGGEDYSFWLDEARANGQTPAVSILGASQRRVEYWGKEKNIEQQGVFVWNENNELQQDQGKNILTYLQHQHGQPTEQATMVSFDGDKVLSEQYSEDALHDMLPFDFRGGHVGYLGYEVRHDTARYLEEEEGGRHHSRETVSRKSDPNVPSAAFLWADRSFVYDHQTCDWYLVGVVPKDNDAQERSTLAWIRSTSTRLQIGRKRTNGEKPRQTGQQYVLPKSSLVVPTFSPNRSRETYNRNFAECIEHIRQGESYELCLTNQLETHLSLPGALPVELYRILRRRNPAPFSAFFNWNASQRRQQTDTKAAVAICCSSPERFVSVKRKRQQNLQDTELNPFTLEVEAKPIKGTTARVLPSAGRKTLTEEERAQDAVQARKLQSSVKDRAENLMIVDLLRNDLSRVCETGTVHVAKLMDIESFATVHQMVSTIRGTLNPSKSGAVDVLTACFPGGSMTGAPKLRTMELLEEIEEGVSRGPYSGCLGYISLNGSMDMNIVIRTAVLTPSSDDSDEWKVSIGAGGAITALSESTDEYDEMMLKASAVMGAVKEWASTVPSGTATDNNDDKNGTHIASDGERDAILELNVTGV